MVPWMSASGTKRTFRAIVIMSAFDPTETSVKPDEPVPACQSQSLSPHLRGPALAKKVADKLTLDEAAAANAWVEGLSRRDIAFLQDE